MELFFDDVSNPWWWAQHIPSALVALAIMHLFKKSPTLAKGYLKWLKLRELKKIKRQRFNYSSVLYEIIKSHCLMLLFSILCITYLYTVTQTSNTPEHWSILVIKSLPLYIVEILYLLQREHAKNLVVYVGKVRINKRYG